MARAKLVRMLGTRLGAAWLAIAVITAWVGCDARARAQTGQARDLDAHVDRVLVVPTAETHPRGTLFLSSYEIIIPSVGYAPSDRLHVSATGLTDFEGGLLVEAHVKANVLRGDLLRVALGTGIDYLRSPEESSDAQNDDFLGARFGAVGQLCITAGCRSSLSVAATVLTHAQTSLLLPVGFGTGAIVYVSDEISALFELSALLNAAEDFGLLRLPLALAGYGLRITPAPSWAVDLGLLRSLREERELRTDAPGLFDLLGTPFLALTWRLRP
jgi:hypothetical protein